VFDGAGNRFNSQRKLKILKRLVFRQELSSATESKIDDSATPAQLEQYVKNAREAVDEELKASQAAKTRDTWGKTDGVDHEIEEKRVYSFPLKCSPLHPVTLDTKARKAANIDEEASFYCYCYPSIRDTVTDNLISLAKIDDVDPFVQWLQTGAFFYFDFKFDIIQINALCWTEMERAQSALCLGPSTQLPQTSIQDILDLGRWSPVSVDLISDFGFTHFAWINASELISDHIFSSNGGFAFMHKDDFDRDKWDKKGQAVLSVDFTSKVDGTGRSRFFPVVPPTSDKREESRNRLIEEVDRAFDQGDEGAVKKIVDILETLKTAKIEDTRFKPHKAYSPLYIPELDAARRHSRMRPGEEGQQSNRFIEELQLQPGEDAAAGLREMLNVKDEVDAITMKKLTSELQSLDAQKLASLEVKSDADGKKLGEACITPVHEELAKSYQADINYVLRETAKEQEVESNDGTKSRIIRDKGRSGWTLETFYQQEESRNARLTLEEVAALRLYTSRLFAVINGPLRQRRPEPSIMSEGSQKSAKSHIKHPLPLTTLLIERALKKLRANHWQANKKFKTFYLWRGLKDRTLGSLAELAGGCDPACMSATPNLGIVAQYAQSKQPLIIRFKVDSPMDLGANIAWLSLFPTEEEYVYPPLTYIKVLFTQEIKNVPGSVVTVTPSFPT